MSKNHNNVYRKKRKSFIPTLVVFVFITAISFGIASLWQIKQTGYIFKPKAEASEHSVQAKDIQSEPEKAKDKKDNEKQQQDKKEDKKDQESLPESCIVGESERVTSTYFDDAVFIGDSISKGISSYNMMSNTTVLANTGLNPETFFTAKKIKTPSGYVTVLDALKDTGAKKIYVMLGSNGIGWYNKDTFIELYEKMLNEIIKEKPNAIIYVQSILPVTKWYSDKTSNNITNQKIDEYNKAIIDLTSKLKLNYVNVAEKFKDENGALPDEASSEGMHFGPTYYTKWFDYLKIHTVKEK